MVVARLCGGICRDRCDGAGPSAARHVDAIRADGIDVLITDLGSAVATYVFSRRAAPVQMWIDMGYPFWSIGELDWVLLPQKDYQGYFGIPSDRYSPLIFRQTPTELVRTVTQEEIDRARAIVPPGRFVIASFGRKIKASAEYLSLIRRLLRELPNAHFLLAGSGVSDDIDRLQSDGEVSAQVTVLPSMVDLSVFGHVIDVFCDTFPFSAGIVAREMQACGVPVVSIRLAEWDRVLREDRDAALLANGPEEYARLVVRLYADQDFREESRSRSLALASTYGQTGLLGDVLEDGIAKAIAYVNARKTQMPGT
jgi:predicted O-linked N-acetylglucosamine transferase (SPINDLY family)